MPLSAEKQARFDELAARRQQAPRTPQIAPQQPQAQTPPVAQPAGVQGQGIQTGLSPEKQARFAELQARRQGNQQDQQETDRLFEQLGGKLPRSGPLPFQSFSVGFGGPTVNPLFAQERTRREAFSQLLEKGFEQKQIEATIKAQKILGGPRIGRSVGGIGGAIATTAIAGRVIPGPLDDIATKLRVEYYLAEVFSIGVGGYKKSEPGIDSVVWFEMEDNNTNIFIRYSTDGVHFIEWFTEVRDNTLTAAPNQVGFGVVNPATTDFDVFATLLAWDGE